MKVAFLALITSLLSLSASARAKIPVCFPCESLETVKEIPTSSAINKMAGEAVHVSYLNKEYGILWTSVWNTDGRFVLSNASNSTYYEIDAEAAKLLKEENAFDVNSPSPLSFWKKAGGKIVFALLIALLIWGQIKPKKKKQPTI
jgi:hypothetical protein